MDAFTVEEIATIGAILWQYHGVFIGDMPSPWTGQCIAETMKEHPGDYTAVAKSIAKKYNVFRGYALKE